MCNTYEVFASESKDPLASLGGRAMTAWAARLAAIVFRSHEIAKPAKKRLRFDNAADGNTVFGR